MTAAADKALGRARYWMVLPWVLLAIGIAASILLFTVIRDAVENVAQLRFERQASDAKHDIEARINSYNEILYGLAALFTSQNSVSRIQFSRYVEALDLEHRYPGFDVVNYAAHVFARDKTRFEAAVRRDTSLVPGGYPNFAIKPPGERAEYYVLVYVEPMASFEFAFGLDLSVNPAIKDAKALAAAVRLTQDSGKPTSSGLPIRIKATSEHKEYVGLAMRLGVYHSGMPRVTVEQRRAAFFGSVGAGFNVENLMKGVVDEEKLRHLSFKLYDAGSAADSAASSAEDKKLLLYDSNLVVRASPAQSEMDNSDAVFTRMLPMEVGGRIWQVQFNARKDAIINRVDAIMPWLVLAWGLISSTLLFGMFYSLAHSRGRALAIAKDMTEDLHVSTEQLQAMSRRLVDVQEAERRQISMNLHDQIGQNLTALGINIDILKSELAASLNARNLTRLDTVASLVAATTNGIEIVISDLRPPMLDDYGLLPALQWYGGEFAGHTGIEVKVTGDEQAARIAPTAEIALFRITQEALNNVAKHARATAVEVSLDYSGQYCSLCISDNGIGLNSTADPRSRRHHGLGMVTMRERTQAVSGQFDFGPGPGGGYRIVVRVPC